MKRFNELQWALATKVAALSKYRLYRPIKGLLGALLVSGVAFFGYQKGKEDGQTEGVDFYHHMCYDVGGIVIDKEGRAVQCARLSQIPKKELDNYSRV
jgi:hypothetical protein